MSSSNSNTIKAQAYFQGEIGRSPLVNKLGITAQQELEAVEAFYVEHAIVNGLSKKAQSLSPAGLCQMHYEMFGEIYEWAGSIVIIQRAEIYLFVFLNSLKIA